MFKFSSGISEKGMNIWPLWNFRVHLVSSLGLLTPPSHLGQLLVDEHFTLPLSLISFQKSPFQNGTGKSLEVCNFINNIFNVFLFLT